jgi:DNA-binding GntR family transcriptional regulator
MSALAEFSAPVDKRSLDRAAADKLRQAIVAGKIAPGARLKEANLALQFQLSRGTVRTALHRLVAEGLVAQRPYSGWQVVSLSSHDAWELYTLRGSLEALAARLAAANMNDTGRHKLWEAFGRLKTAVRAKNDEAMTDADFAIHKMIVDLAGHKRLAAQYALVEQQTRLYIASSNAMLRRRELVLRNHEDLLKAIASGNPDFAEKVARTHGLKASNELINHLRTKENVQPPSKNKLRIHGNARMATA